MVSQEQPQISIIMKLSLDVAFNPLAGRTGIRTDGYGAVNIYYNSIYIGGTDISAGNSYGII